MGPISADAFASCSSYNDSSSDPNLLFANPGYSIIKLKWINRILSGHTRSQHFRLLFHFWILIIYQTTRIAPIPEASFGSVLPGFNCRSLDGVVFFNFDRRHGARIASLCLDIYRNYPTPGDRNSLHIQTACSGTIYCV